MNQAEIKNALVQNTINKVLFFKCIHDLIVFYSKLLLIYILSVFLKNNKSSFSTSALDSSFKAGKALIFLFFSKKKYLAIVFHQNIKHFTKKKDLKILLKLYLT